MAVFSAYAQSFRGPSARWRHKNIVNFIQECVVRNGQHQVKAPPTPHHLRVKNGAILSLRCEFEDRGRQRTTEPVCLLCSLFTFLRVILALGRGPEVGGVACRRADVSSCLISGQPGLPA